jgi:hypothetical protein
VFVLFCELMSWPRPVALFMSIELCCVRHMSAGLFDVTHLTHSSKKISQKYQLLYP